MQEPSIQNAVWSHRLHSNPMPIDETVEHTYFNQGNVAHGQEEYGKYPSIVGLHNGTGFGQDQTDPFWQKRQLNPYPHPRGPYLSNHMDQLVPTPTMYVNELASTGGAPLSIALDDPITLEHFMDSEARREAPDNPFSAKYAKTAIEKLEWDPTLGSQRDTIRRNLKTDEEDLDTTGRKIAAGFYSEPTHYSHAVSGLPMHPEVERFIHRTREPTREDFDTLADKMTTATDITRDQGKQLRFGMRNSVFASPINADNSLISSSSTPVLSKIYQKKSPFSTVNPAGRKPPLGLSSRDEYVMESLRKKQQVDQRRRSSIGTNLSGAFGEASPLGLPHSSAPLESKLGPKSGYEQDEESPPRRRRSTRTRFPTRPYSPS